MGTQTDGDVTSPVTNHASDRVTEPITNRAGSDETEPIAMSRPTDAPETIGQRRLRLLEAVQRGEMTVDEALAQIDGDDQGRSTQ